MLELLLLQGDTRHISMARIFVQTLNSYVFSKGFHFVPSAVCGHRLNAFAGIQQVAISEASCVPAVHVLLSAKRNYKTRHNMPHLTAEEQFILQVSNVLSLH